MYHEILSAYTQYPASVADVHWNEQNVQLSIPLNVSCSLCYTDSQCMHGVYNSCKYNYCGIAFLTLMDDPYEFFSFSQFEATIRT